MPLLSPHPLVVIPDIPLGELVLRGAHAYPERPAFVDAVSGRRLSFGELLEQVRRLAAGLSRRIHKGDVVAIWAPNVPEYAVVFHAVARLGAVLTTINPAYTNEEATFQLRDSGARLLVTTAALSARARASAAAASLPLEIVTIDAAPDLASLDAIALDAEPPHVAIDPSGRRGPAVFVRDDRAAEGRDAHSPEPRGQSRQIDALEVQGPRGLRRVLPFFHIYGMVVIMNFGLMRGATW